MRAKKTKDLLDKFGVRTLPWLIVVDAKGVVRAEGIGVEDVEKAVKETGAGT